MVWPSRPNCRITAKTPVDPSTSMAAVGSSRKRSSGPPTMARRNGPVGPRLPKAIVWRSRSGSDLGPLDGQLEGSGMPIQPVYQSARGQTRTPGGRPLPAPAEAWLPSGLGPSAWWGLVPNTSTGRRRAAGVQAAARSWSICRRRWVREVPASRPGPPRGRDHRVLGGAPYRRGRPGIAPLQSLPFGPKHLSGPSGSFVSSVQTPVMRLLRSQRS